MLHSAHIPLHVQSDISDYTPSVISPFPEHQALESKEATLVVTAQLVGFEDLRLVCKPAMTLYDVGMALKEALRAPDLLRIVKGGKDIDFNDPFRPTLEELGFCEDPVMKVIVVTRSGSPAFQPSNNLSATSAALLRKIATKVKGAWE